jgi:hypothetical protein
MVVLLFNFKVVLVRVAGWSELVVPARLASWPKILGNASDYRYIARGRVGRVGAYREVTWGAKRFRPIRRLARKVFCFVPLHYARDVDHMILKTPFAQVNQQVGMNCA